MDHAIKLTNILREAISNANKHARPTRIHVEFKQVYEKLSLRICNYGRIKDCRKRVSGIGLSGIQSKVNSLNGRFAIRQLERQVCLEIAIHYAAS